MQSFRVHTKGVFLSTPSARRATATVYATRKTASNFYPRPPRGGRHLCIVGVDLAAYISIHALREEGDSLRSTGSTVRSRFLSTPSARRATNHAGPFVCPEAISIHALREEGDPGLLWSVQAA